MNEFENKQSVLREYCTSLPAPKVKMNIDQNLDEKLVNSVFKREVNFFKKSQILGYINTSFAMNPSGMVFMKDKMYYYRPPHKLNKIWYDEISSIQSNSERNKEATKISILFENEKKLNISYDKVDKEMLRAVLLRMRNIESEAVELNENLSNTVTATTVDLNEEKLEEIFMQGMAAHFTAIQTQDLLFNEANFSAVQGHGFAAEQANNLFDRLTFHDAKVIGADNAKNGADRLVDGIEIQSKYCATGSRCINECFEDGGKGTFRYINSKGGPMQIEVPKDKYESSIEAMKEKIRKGQVPGISDPEQAEEIIRKGHFTYEQAKNITQFGKIESVAYDAVHGVIVGAGAMGMSYVLTFAISVWQGEDIEVANERALSAGLQIFGTAFLNTFISKQLMKANNKYNFLNEERLRKIFGSDNYDRLIKFLTPKNKGNVSSSQAKNNAEKILKNNVIIYATMIIVNATFKGYELATGKISGKQFAKENGVFLSGLAGGVIATRLLQDVAPWYVQIPVSIIASGVSAMLAKKGLDTFIDDDSVAIGMFINKQLESYCIDYLLNDKEIEKLLDATVPKLDEKKFKKIHQLKEEKDKKGYIDALCVPTIEYLLKKRKKIKRKA